MINRLLAWIRVSLTDLRGDLSRFGVLIACLALGTGVIAAVGSVGDNLRNTIERDAAILLGGDIEISRPDRNADAGELAFMRTLGSVAHVVDTSARARADDESALLDLMAVDSFYPLRGEVVSPELTAGQKPAALLGERSGVYGAIIDPVLLDRLGIGPDERFNIGGTTFEIRGTLVSLPDGAVRGLNIGVTTLISTDAMAQMTDLRPPLPGLLTHHRYKIVLSGVTEAEAIELALQNLDTGWTIRTPRDAAGSLVQYYELFVRFLIVVGLSSLLIGGVGVANGVTAYVSERLRSIATLRSLGATGARIMVHFLIQIGLLLMIGVLLGLGIGIAASFLILPTLGQALDLTLVPTVEPAPLLTAAGFGLLLGFAFSYIPLVRTRKISPIILFRAVDSSLPALGFRDLVNPATWLLPLAALAGVFWLALATTNDLSLVTNYAIGAVAALVFLLLAARVLQILVRRLPVPEWKSLRHALGHIWRPGSPSLVMMVSIGLGLSVLLVIALVQINLSNQLLGAVSRDVPTFVATDLFEDEVQAIEQLVHENPAFASVNASPMMRGAIVGINGGMPTVPQEQMEEAAFLLSGEIPITWKRSLPEGSTVVEGEWWPSDYDGPALVSLRSSLKPQLGLQIGDTLQVRLFGEVIDARIANFRDYDWQNGINFIITLSPGYVESFPSTFLGAIKAAPGEEKQAERELVRAFPEVSFLPVGDIIGKISELLDQLGSAVAVVGGIAVLNGLLILAGTMAAGRKQREADAVIQKVMGATRADILEVFVLEHGLLGALSGLFAAAIGIAAAAVITWTTFEIDFVPDLVLVAAIIAGTTVLTIATGAVMTWRALSIKPARYLRTA